MSNYDAYYPMAVDAANRYGVPADYFASIIRQESNWNPLAHKTTTGASGLGQVLASTARDPGYGIPSLADRFDPASNLDFSANYLSKLKSRYGSWAGAIKAYSGSANPYGGRIDSAIQAADAGGGGAVSRANPSVTQDGSGVAGGGAASASPDSGITANPATWLPGAGNYLSAVAGRLGLFVLAVLFISGAIGLFALQSGITIENASAKP